MADTNTINVITNALKKITIFNCLPPEVIKNLAGMAAAVMVKRNKTAIIEDVLHRDRIYIFISGKMKVRLNNVNQWKDLNFGDIFCASRASDAVLHVDHALALQDTLLFHFPGPEFEELINTCLETYQEEAGTVIDDGKNVSTESDTEEGDASEEPEKKNWFFDREHTCPVCNNKFTSLMPRSRYVQAEKVDSDLCTYFRLVNPTFYYIVVCGECGYAFPQDSNGKLPAEIVKNLKFRLDKTTTDYSGRRDIDRAISAYRLAIACQETANAKNSLLGRLHLRLGCLYRQKEMRSEERECLQKALHYMQEAYMYENITEPKSELKLLYLIGELHGRMGDVKEAVQWLSRVTNHPYKDIYPYMVNRARDRWQELKRGATTE